MRKIPIKVEKHSHVIVNGEKYCSFHKEMHSVSAFYTSTYKSDKSGYTRACKQGRSELAKARRLKNAKTPLHTITNGMKWCTRCKTKHPAEAFGRCAATISGYAYSCKTSLNQLARKDDNGPRDPGVYTPKHVVIKGEKEVVKFCSSCGVDHPLNAFRQTPDALSGYDWRCKKAATEYGRQYRIEKGFFKGERQSQRVVDGMKWCPGCQTTHAIADFYVNNRTVFGLGTYCKKHLAKDMHELSTRYVKDLIKSEMRRSHKIKEVIVPENAIALKRAMIGFKRELKKWKEASPNG